MSSREKGKHRSRHHTHAKKPSGAITPKSEYTPAVSPEAAPAAAPAAPAEGATTEPATATA